jgi:hypothetical protein
VYNITIVAGVNELQIAEHDRLRSSSREVCHPESEDGKAAKARINCKLIDSESKPIKEPFAVI